MIKARIVPYCLLNYKKNTNPPPWIFDVGPWEDYDIPKHHKTKFLSRIELDNALSVYSRLLEGEKIYINQLINIKEKGEKRYRLSLQITENFPEVVLKVNGGLVIDLSTKKKRERECFKKGFTYTPWSRTDELRT